MRGREEARNYQLLLHHLSETSEQYETGELVYRAYFSGKRLIAANHAWQRRHGRQSML